MAVLELTIKTALINLADILKEEEDVEAGKEKWASELAKIIKDAILSADVKPGISVATTGTAAAQTGATTTTGSLI